MRRLRLLLLVALFGEWPLPRREPPYDEFLDRHPILLWCVLTFTSVLALALLIAYTGRLLGVG